MATEYTYPDAYLAKFCIAEREERAIADIAVMAGTATLSSEWTERLVITQTYILACQENQADPEDLFTAKLKTYRSQLNALLPQALRAAADVAGEVSSVGFFSIPLERA